MKRSSDKIPIGTKIKNATGELTILGYAGRGKEKYYICSYKSDINPAYDESSSYVPEKDINFLKKYIYEHREL